MVTCDTGAKALQHLIHRDITGFMYFIQGTVHKVLNGADQTQRLMSQIRGKGDDERGEGEDQ